MSYRPNAGYRPAHAPGGDIVESDPCRTPLLDCADASVLDVTPRPELPWERAYEEGTQELLPSEVVSCPATERVAYGELEGETAAEYLERIADEWIDIANRGVFPLKYAIEREQGRLRNERSWGEKMNSTPSQTDTLLQFDQQSRIPALCGTLPSQWAQRCAVSEGDRNQLLSNAFADGNNWEMMGGERFAACDWQTPWISSGDEGNTARFGVPQWGSLHQSWIAQTAQSWNTPWQYYLPVDTTGGPRATYPRLGFESYVTQ